MAVSLNTTEQVALKALSHRFPSTDAALAEIAALNAALRLPAGVVHVISDVHGEYAKLRHVINNASGSLRPLVMRLFAERLTDLEIEELLGVLYYPLEFVEERAPTETEARRLFVRHTMRLQFEIVRELARAYRERDLTAIFPAAYSELIVAGDLGDRGPRVDRVIDYLMRQPNVSIVWGNHDMPWLGACLGQETMIATVLRFSIRYSRLGQLEEGYGISLAPLEKLAREVYGNDPAEQFTVRGSGLRDARLMAQMQKAIAIILFKLEGQLIAKHPEWNLAQRNLLHRIGSDNRTITMPDGVVHELLDTYLPTLNHDTPYELSAEEAACLQEMRQAFTASVSLWQHMTYMVQKGTMWCVRDDALIFHACVPVDAEGAPLTLNVQGKGVSGREMFDAFEVIIRRALRKTAIGLDEDADWLWYLWAGDVSPLFGKDKMATFETHFLADTETHEEHKNPYFAMLHEVDFCERILKIFGCSPETGLIVNGHVPVKVEKGEHPLKRSGKAVTIDGAFSEAYGDRGYTLILAPDRIALAEHHHFESIDEAITQHIDIVPTVQDLREYHPPRTCADTRRGDEMRAEVAQLTRLIGAYENGAITECMA